MELTTEFSETNCSIKKIHIQDLERKNVDNQIDPSSKNVKGMLDLREATSWKTKDGEEYTESNIYALYESGPKIKYWCSNYFIAPYLHAYNNHQDVVFSVNDLWSIITLMTSKYIDDHGEELRSKIVSHEGKKELTVIEYADSCEESLQMEKQWDYFFEQMHRQIKENTKDGVVDVLENNFSVSNTFYKLFSTVTIMNSFKKYFEYGRMILGCGIPNVYLEGTLDDWILLKNKISSLSCFAVSESENDWLNLYIKKVSVIIDKFIDTYNGNVDVSFWNNIMTTEVFRIGSGGDTQTTMEGWITHFLGIYTKINDFDDVKNHKMIVPVKLLNELTNTKKDLTLYGAFTGITYDTVLDAYRPQITMVMYHHV